jgi:hypothetical protein
MGVELLKKILWLALGLMVVVLIVPVVLFVAGGAVVFALSLVGLILSAVVLGMLGLSALFLLPLALLLGMAFGVITHPVLEILLVVIGLYLIYRGWQYYRACAAF